jgi:SET domain-containing protein
MIRPYAPVLKCVVTPRMIFDESDPRFYAAPSRVSGAGRGLFARVPLRAGDRLAVPGVLLRRDSDADRYTNFADEYKFRVGDHVLIPCGVAAMANHATEPNIQKVIEGRALFLELLRDVDAGEELCFAYSEYARERFGLA